ncbi:unnamed protein product [Candidula unifasciata]|uniref:Uncharacterized protein n=1 Tax=Candidula unifasciata TaxID=100452 RepID=A0A8S3ZHH1_9EUPU|nr:unnamed protein product [Candidula unifasciata]
MSCFHTLRFKLRHILWFNTFGVLTLLTLGFLVYVNQVVHIDGVVKNSIIFRFYHKSITRNESYISLYEPDIEPAPEIQACVHPVLSVNDSVMMKFFKTYPKIVCGGEENWISVQNGTIRFSVQAKQNHKNFHCNYFPVIRGPGDNSISFGQPIVNIRNGAPLVSDFFKIVCKDFKRNKYINIHAGIHVNNTIKERLKIIKPPANGLGLSIALLGFDSMSRMSWLRRMPRTREFLVKELKAIELEGYNILGDGTPAALFPILTGKLEQELPEARRNVEGAKPVDDFPWLWRNFSKHGYVTSWADAQIKIAPFNYRLLGFQHSPTDYFMRPFYLAVNPLYGKFSPNCHGSLPRHMVWFNWIRDIFYMYKNDPKFLVHFYTPLSHDDNNWITMADEDLRTFIYDLEKGGFLNNTLLVVMGDHGARFAEVRRTVSGKLEERMPYVSLRFPPWFELKYPHLIKNIRTNVNRLTTPFDLHETFKDFLLFDEAGLGDVKNRGISLFKEIPLSRTCDHAGVTPHWCACTGWTSVPETDPHVRRALQTTLEVLNNFTDPFRSDCALLRIGNVSMVSKKSANEADIYQITFFTEPGKGEFEVTLEHDTASNEITLNSKSISRINQYGNDPACVLNKNREIRQYCYCNSNLNASPNLTKSTD